MKNRGAMIKSLILTTLLFLAVHPASQAWEFGPIKGDDPRPIDPPPRIPDPFKKGKEVVSDTVENGKKTVSDGAETAKSNLSDAAETTKKTVNNADAEIKNGSTAVHEELKVGTTSIANELQNVVKPVAKESKKAFAPAADVLSNIRKQFEVSANDAKHFFSPLTDKTNELTDNLGNWWEKKSDNDNNIKHYKKMIDDSEIEHANAIANWNVEINKQNLIRSQALLLVNEYSKIKLLKNSVQSTCKSTDSVFAIDSCVTAINGLIENEAIFLKSTNTKLEMRSMESQSLAELTKKTIGLIDQDIKINTIEIAALKDKRKHKISDYADTVQDVSCQDRSLAASKYLNIVLQNLKNSMSNADAWGVRTAKVRLKDYQKVKALLLPTCNLLNKAELVQIENRIYLTYSSWNEDLWFKSSCQQYSQYTKFNNELQNQSEMLSLCQRNVKTDQFISALSQELIQLRSRGGVR